MFRRGMHQTADLDGLTKLERYEATARRAFYKALEELRRLRAARNREAAVLDKTVAARADRPVLHPRNETKSIPNLSSSPVTSPNTVHLTILIRLANSTRRVGERLRVRRG